MQVLYKMFNRKVFFPSYILPLFLFLPIQGNANELQTVSSLRENTMLTKEGVNKTVDNEDSKQKLIKKLNLFNFFSSDFSQQVQSFDGNAIQDGKGTLTVKKPNRVYWHTTEPDETLIISNGETLWFYDPFVDQATAYTLQKIIANTPILLLTTDSQSLWANYQVSELSKDHFVIKAIDETSQVKKLEINFNGDILAQLVIVDATQQKSTITLTKLDHTLEPNDKLFQFELPQGVNLDDQR